MLPLFLTKKRLESIAGFAFFEGAAHVSFDGQFWRLFLTH